MFLITDHFFPLGLCIACLIIRLDLIPFTESTDFLEFIGVANLPSNDSDHVELASSIQGSYHLIFFANTLKVVGYNCTCIGWVVYT